jgi:hypothetical protein
MCLHSIEVLSFSLLQLPQFISNYKNKSAEALSPWFLAEWLLVSAARNSTSVCCTFVPLTSLVHPDKLAAAMQGDTSNLLGCLLQGEQLPTTTYTAM